MQRALVFKNKKRKATKSGMKFLLDKNLSYEIPILPYLVSAFIETINRTKSSTFNMADPDTLIKAKIHYFAREKYYHSMQVRPLLYILLPFEKRNPFYPRNFM